MGSYTILDSTDPENYIKYKDVELSVVDQLLWTVHTGNIYTIFRKVEERYYALATAPSIEDAEKWVSWSEFRSSHEYHYGWYKMPKDTSIADQVRFCLKWKFPIDRIPKYLPEYKIAEQVESGMEDTQANKELIYAAIQDVEYILGVDGTFDRDRIYSDIREYFIKT